MPKAGNPKRWIKKAEEDYEAAYLLSKRRRTPLSDAACFHAQQCAEKYLKAFLVLHRVYFPKTHDLLELANLAIPLEPSLELLKPWFASLTPYAVAFRYPDEQATSADVRRAMTAMRRIRERLRHVLKLRA